MLPSSGASERDVRRRVEDAEGPFSGATFLEPTNKWDCSDVFFCKKINEVQNDLYWTRLKNSEIQSIKKNEIFLEIQADFLKKLP